MKSLIKHITILFSTGFLLFLVNCGGDENDTPSPQPDPNITHTITINSNVSGAVFKVFDGGSTQVLRPTDSNGSATLKFTNKETTTTVDSITGTKADYVKYKVVNQVIGASKTYTVNMDEVTYNYWLEGSTNAESIKGWKDGSELLTWSGSEDNYQTNTIIDTATSIVLDSLVFSGIDKVTYKEEGVTLEPDGTTKNIDLVIINSFWVEGTTNAESIIGWVDEVQVLTWDGTVGSYQTNTIKDIASQIILDSLVYSGIDKVTFNLRKKP